MFGFLLFILPGFYLLARLMFSPYIGLMENIPILDSVKKSFKITKDKGWNLLGYIAAIIFPIIIILIVILAGFTVLLLPGNLHVFMAFSFFGSFLTFIYLAIYIYRLFINLKKIEDESI